MVQFPVASNMHLLLTGHAILPSHAAAFKQLIRGNFFKQLLILTLYVYCLVLIL